jgi:hypothetical protein
MKSFRPVAMLLALFVVASMTSCTKEGVYTPKEKIKRVYVSSSSTEKYLSQSWNWDGKLLGSIDHYSSNGTGTLSWTEDFTYDGKRLARVDYFVGSESTVYEYDGKYLKNANYYYRGELAATSSYEYSKGKMSKMTITNYDSKSRGKGHLETSYLPFQDEVVKACNKCLTMLQSNNLEKALDIMTYQFTWEGNNVSKVVATPDGEMATVSLYYDSKNNPLKSFHNLYSDVESDLGPVVILSKNNVTKMIATYNGDNDVVDYTYLYNSDDYPVMQIEKYPDYDDQYIVYYEYE